MVRTVAAPSTTYLHPNSEFVSVEGQNLHVARAGNGPTLLLLHGSGASLHIFDRVAELLIDRFDVVRIDLPGFGLTGPRRDRDYSVAAYVSLVTRFVAEHISQPFLLGGHSFGGQIAWTYALDNPPALRGLVLMNATGYPEKRPPQAIRLARNPLLRPVMRRWGSRAATARSLQALVGDGSLAVDDAMVDRVHALMSLPGNRAAFVDFANTQQPDRSPEIPRIAVPTLILRSDLVGGQHFARDIPASRDIELTGVGHLMPAEAPQRVADAIASFESDLGGSR